MRKFQIRVSDSFFPLLKDQHFYLLMYGGRGSGKSEFAGRKCYYRCMKEGQHRFLIMRKVRSRTRESVIELIQRILDENEMKYRYNKTDRIISFYNALGLKNELLFDGLDDPEKIKSIKGITGIWLEETTEFTKKDFNLIDLSLREPTKYYKQIMMTFNPDEAEAPWLKDMFFDTEQQDAKVHHSTVEDNPVKELRDTYRQRLDRLDDQTYLDIYRWGKWALPKGKIFFWDEQPLPDIRFDDVFYGGDFGYSIDPAAVVRIFRKADEFWVQELIYETGLTNAALAKKAKEKGVGPEDEIFFDSAEPKSIDEIKEEGLNAKPALKGPDSVRAGIDYLKNLKIHIVEGSDNLKSEVRKYKYKEDSSGNTTAEPVKFDDHAISATRYGIYTYMKESGQYYFGFSEEKWP